jgi:hypothetical protein
MCCIVCLFVHFTCCVQPHSKKNCGEEEVVACLQVKSPTKFPSTGKDASAVNNPTSVSIGTHAAISPMGDSKTTSPLPSAKPLHPVLLHTIAQVSSVSVRVNPRMVLGQSKKNTAPAIADSGYCWKCQVRIDIFGFHELFCPAHIFLSFHVCINFVTRGCFLTRYLLQVCIDVHIRRGPKPTEINVTAGGAKLAVPQLHQHLPRLLLQQTQLQASS